jgi:beta-lactam-binding protein with PASTA domain
MRLRVFLRLAALSLVLLMVAMISALTAMRFAIHGREVAVPKLIGMTPAESERIAENLGLQISIERQYYSPDIGVGKIMTQVPDPGTRVRRGWKVRVAESLGPQRVSIPDLLGDSERAAEINIRRRGLEVGSVAEVEVPGQTPGQVISQSPAANASGVAAPRINLLVSAAPGPAAFVMPSFLGQSLTTADRSLQDGGMKVVAANAPAPPPGGSAPPSPAMQTSSGSIVVAQNPAPGQRIESGSAVTLTTRP